MKDSRPAPSQRLPDHPFSTRAGPRTGRRRRIVSRVFTAVTASVPAARAWTLRQLRRSAVDPDVADRVVLLVSELATNAVQHTTSSRFTLRLDLTSHVEARVRADNRTQPR